MSKKAAKKAAAPVKASAKKVTLEAKKRLCEGGEIYQPGDKITLTEARANSLGPVVGPVTSEN